jgi:predicted Rossmann fold nucleotide-binding protein DprA/Smf involved in DNA uptake
MSSNEYLSKDGEAVLALCSSLGLTEPGNRDETEPFKLSEWNQLSRQIEKSALKRPSGLAGRTASELTAQLGISSEEAERIVRLLERSGGLSLVLERLASQGVWAVTRVDEAYPAKLRDTLKEKAPSVLFGSGDVRLLQRPGLAVVGSRNIDAAGTQYATEIGRKAVDAGLAVVSGGARGTDRIAMNAALEADGFAVGALADSLEATLRKPDVGALLLEGRLALVTPYAPSAGFSVGAAMGRNKVIYGLSDFAVIVSSDFQTGGTWSGAIEALKADWCPVFARDGKKVPVGNRELIKLGATGLPENEIGALGNLRDWMQQHAKAKIVEQDLF